MNLLIDIGHPGHVHLFKNLFYLLESDGHTVIITTRNIPSVTNLLKTYRIPYILLGSKKDTILGKGIKQLTFISRLLRIYRKYNIDLAFGSSISIAQISKIMRRKSIIFDDDDDQVEPLVVKYGHKYSSAILSPDSIVRRSKKNISYAGTHELAYLHPNYFKPDKKVLDLLGVKENEKFFILRFVALKGHHDVGEKGLSLGQKLMIIERLKLLGRVFVTTERKIEPELKQYKIQILPEIIHSALFYATMFIGDSQTMTSEAAVLGTPALKCNTFAGRLSVPNELEKKFDLCFSYLPDDFEKMLIKMDDLLNMPDLKGEWQKKRHQMLKDKIDVTAFFVWFIENYPSSLQIMKENPDYQYTFK